MRRSVSLPGLLDHEHVSLREAIRGEIGLGVHDHVPLVAVRAGDPTDEDQILGFADFVIA